MAHAVWASAEALLEAGHAGQVCRCSEVSNGGGGGGGRRHPLPLIPCLAGLADRLVCYLVGWGEIPALQGWRHIA